MTVILNNKKSEVDVNNTPVEKTILLVEDDPNDKVLALDVFKKSNIMNKVVVAHDGAEALDYLFGEGDYSGRDTSAMPKIILLDMYLPKISGLEVLERIRTDERTKHIPVIIVSSSIEASHIMKSYKAGANSYIRKPIDFAQLREAVHQMGFSWLDC